MFPVLTRPRNVHPSPVVDFALLQRRVTERSRVPPPRRQPLVHLPDRVLRYLTTQLISVASLTAHRVICLFYLLPCLLAASRDTSGLIFHRHPSLQWFASSLAAKAVFQGSAAFSRKEPDGKYFLLCRTGGPKLTGQFVPLNRKVDLTAYSESLLYLPPVTARS